MEMDSCPENTLAAWSRFATAKLDFAWENLAPELDAIRESTWWPIAPWLSYCPGPGFPPACLEDPK
jgi:hypothetical protein